jgi:uncharacterized protein
VKHFNAYGVASGEMVRYDLEGNIAMAADMQRDRPIAIYEGAARKVVSVNTGGVHTNFTTAYDGGAAAMQASFSGPEYINDFLLMGKNGKKVLEYQQKGSEINGNYVNYWPNGNVRISMQYFYDNYDGVCKRYYENGKLMSEESFYLGDLHGPAKYYDEQGNLVKSTTYYLDAEVK